MWRRVAFGSYLGGLAGLALVVAALAAVSLFMSADERVARAGMLRGLFVAAAAAVPLWAAAGGAAAFATRSRGDEGSAGPPRGHRVATTAFVCALGAVATAWSAGRIPATLFASRLFASAPPPAMPLDASRSTRAEAISSMTSAEEVFGRIETEEEALWAAWELDRTRQYRAVPAGGTVDAVRDDAFEARRRRTIAAITDALREFRARDGAPPRPSP